MPPHRPLVRVCVLVSALALFYAAYRGYYALGGTVGMFGEPASRSQWLGINAFAAIALLVAAAVPMAALALWRWRYPRLVALALFSVAAVGLVMHGLIDEIQRVLSLSGLAERWQLTLTAESTQGWIWKNQHAADLQDALFNEPWFLAVGLLCGAVVWLALGGRRARRRWLAAAAAAVLALTVYGVLAAVGIVGRSIVF